MPLVDEATPFGMSRYDYTFQVSMLVPFPIAILAADCWLVVVQPKRGGDCGSGGAGGDDSEVSVDLWHVLLGVAVAQLNETARASQIAASEKI